MSYRQPPAPVVNNRTPSCQARTRYSSSLFYAFKPLTALETTFRNLLPLFTPAKVFALSAFHL
jgi:hypothetical protein